MLHTLPTNCNLRATNIQKREFQGHCSGIYTTNTNLCFYVIRFRAEEIFDFGLRLVEAFDSV
jgi:hypothetical protein